jgi:hypothetical protein
MSKLIDLKGVRFAYLVVTERAGADKHGHVMWLCQCDCGKQKVVKGHKLLSGDYKSCGCMHHKYGHGQSDSRLYHIWRTMKARCVDTNSHKYHAYGGRGITICDEWLNSFESFYDWAMANGYREDLSIDRIDNDDNYDPSNCRWASAKEQANNTRANRNIEYNGESHTLAEWADIKGLTKSALHHRLSRGWSISDALSTPMLNRTVR